MSQFNDPSFKRLRDEYYALLRASGFEDIENEAGFLIDHRSGLDAKQRIGFQFSDNGIQDYYTWALEMTEYGVFRRKSDLAIWELHAQGLPSRTIGKSVGLEWSWVCRKIKHIRKYLSLQTRFEPDDE